MPPPKNDAEEKQRLARAALIALLPQSELIRSTILAQGVGGGTGRIRLTVRIESDVPSPYFLAMEDSSGGLEKKDVTPQPGPTSKGNPN